MKASVTCGVGGLCSGWSFCPHVSLLTSSRASLLVFSLPAYKLASVWCSWHPLLPRSFGRLNPDYAPPPGLKWCSAVHPFHSCSLSCMLSHLSQQSLFKAQGCFGCISSTKSPSGHQLRSQDKPPRRNSMCYTVCMYVLRDQSTFFRVQGYPRTLPFSCHRGREGPLG